MAVEISEYIAFAEGLSLPDRLDALHGMIATCRSLKKWDDVEDLEQAFSYAIDTFKGMKPMMLNAHQMQALLLRIEVFMSELENSMVFGHGKVQLTGEIRQWMTGLQQDIHNLLADNGG